MKPHRGHIDLKAPAWILGILLVILLWERIPAAWFWSGTGALALLGVIVVAVSAHRKEPRAEEIGGRTIVHFDGQRIEMEAAPLETKRWTSGGAFGQPLESWMALMRGDEVVYQGRERDAERLLAFMQAYTGKKT